MTSFALIGLGKMGGNMARRLVRGGVRPALYDLNPDTTQALADELQCHGAKTITELIDTLEQPRVVWLMLPAGEATETMISHVQAHLVEGDVLVDGANSNYHDAQRRAATLKRKAVTFADAGVSGGVHGLANGYCMMVGGDDYAIERLRPYLRILAPSHNQGWLHTGPVGSGHFVKMIHNGIEYGMMQAFAEGFALMGAKSEFKLNLGEIGELWRHGSVVRSWLLDLTAEALQADPNLSGVKPVVADSGEGRWTAEESIKLGIPTPVMTLALMMRFASQGQDEFGAKLLAKMRQGFGGHAVVKAE